MTDDTATLDRATPIFRVRDLREASDWYQHVLGFVIAWESGDPPKLVSVCRDAVEVNLSVATGEIPSSAAYFEVSGVDAYHDRIVRCGGRIAVPVGDREYGMRDFRVLDPAGNELSFGEASLR